MTLLIWSDDLYPQDPCVSLEHSIALYNQNDQFIGCRIEEVPKDSIYAKLDVKIGDIITPNSSDTKIALSSNSVMATIKGTSSHNPQQAMKVYQKENVDKNLKSIRLGQKKSLKK